MRLIFVLLIWSHLVSITSAKLLQVQVLSRHCDRTLTSQLDFVNNRLDWQSKLQQGWGMLTNVGLNQCYGMGEKIKERYLMEDSETRIDGISVDYDSDEYLFYATHKDRTIRSVYAAGMGIFGFPIEDQEAGRDCYAIPVQSNEQENDILMRSYDLCEKISADFAAYIPNSPEWEELRMKYEKDIQDRICSPLGVVPDHCQMEHANTLYHQFVFYNNHDYFYNVSFTEEDKEFVQGFQDEMEYLYGEKVLTTYGSKFLLMAIMKNMDLIQQNGSVTADKGHKYVHFSGHDTSIAALFSATNLSQSYDDLKISPLLGSAVFFELHLNESSGEFHVEIFWHTRYDGEWQKYNLIPDQDYLLLSDFKTFLNENSIPGDQDWCDNCQPDLSSDTVNYCLQVGLKNQYTYNTSAVVLLIVLSFILILLVVLIFVCILAVIRSEWQDRKVGYANLEDEHDGGDIPKNIVVNL